MRIQFCGADRTVTGSSHLIEINGRRILLDCGMYQGAPQDAKRLNHYLPEHPEKIDAVILSHGHLDHCGKLPVLYRAGYRGPIYCTPATQAVSQIVLYDAAKIQQENIDYLCRKSLPAEACVLFNSADVEATLALMKNVDYEKPTTLFDGITFTYFDAGHILGSTYILMQLMENGVSKRLLFTADVGRYNSPILRDPTLVNGVCDAIITESTYGNSLHGPMENVEPQFLAAVQSCIAKRSRLLVPSFAVGRTQTVLWYMQKFINEKKIPAIPIYVDSPMGVAISKITSQYRDMYDDETKQMIGDKDIFGLSHITFTSSVEDSKRINADSGPCVIIASSPSCDFGRILHHLKHSVGQANDLVTFCGWTPPYTLGRRLQNGEKNVQILGRWYDVRCRVDTIHGLSAHADAAELMKFLTPALSKDSKVFVVHGEVPQAEGLAQTIRNAGTSQVSVPVMGSDFMM
jgi:metallo-beta-lactamase family protein